MEFPLLGAGSESIRYLLVGPRGSGKTTLAGKILNNQDFILKRPYKEVIVCHEALDPLFKLLAQEMAPRGVVFRFVHGPPNEVVAEIEANGGASVPTLILLDDMLLRLEREGREIEKLFVWGSTKLKVDVMLLVQNLYHKAMRNISIQCNIIILMQMKRAEDQLTHLASTILGKQNRSEFLKAYHACMKLKPMSYFVIDQRRMVDERMQFFTGLLPDEPRIYFCPD